MLSAPDTPLVMVIDDRGESRFLIRHALEAGKYRVIEATGGRHALDLLETVRPDVILLDVCMPGMSGYDVCRAVKSRDETGKIPLILVSSLSDRDSLAEGFRAGAVDYIAKPVRPEELCARVGVHSELNRARRELEESHARLAALNREKDVMFGVAAHDLRGPLAVIMGFAENLLGRAEASGVARHSVEVILRESRQMEHFLGTLLDLEALERGGAALKLHVLDLDASARLALERAGPAAERKSLALHLAASEGAVVARADGGAVRRVLDNLLSNAVKFTPCGGRVMVRVTSIDNEVRCTISDNGPGLTDADRERVFTRFARLSARPTAGEKSTGLGLAICRALVERMGGRVWCGNNPEGGAFFSVALPAAAVSESPVSVVGGLSVSPFPHLMAGREPA